MAGYSFATPVTPNNCKRKSYNPNSNRMNGTFSMNRQTPKSSKVLKSKTRLKRDTFKASSREMFFKNYVAQQLNPPKLNNYAPKPQSIFPFRGNNGYSDERLFDGRNSFNLMTAVKSHGLSAIGSVKVSHSPLKTSQLYNNRFSTTAMGCLISKEQNSDKRMSYVETAKSKVSEIEDKWKLPQESNIFKQSLKEIQNMDSNLSIFPDKNEELVHNHTRSIREIQLSEKFNIIKDCEKERKSFSQTIRSFLRFPSFKLPSLRQFIPYRSNDHVISEEAKVEIVEDKLVPFTQEMENELRRILNTSNQMICTAFSINIYTKDLLTLCGTQWLNDSVIEFYLNLVALRSESPNYPKVYTMSTFFFTRLSKGQNLGRWANKLDFFSYDILIVPIHSAAHWRLAIVDNGKKCIQYYDSLGGEFRQCVDLLAKFLQNESLNKKKQPLNMSEWSLDYSIPNIPLQNNSYDCGVFTCKYADYLARRKPITFTQENIPYFRKCMIYEIIHKKLLT